MKFNNVTLEGYLSSAKENKYKNKVHLRYDVHYLSFKEIVSKTHDNVTALANYEEAKRFIHSEQHHLIFLNDHGIDHVNTVIKRATALVEAEHCNLNIREVYYLLLAIHVHDIGNIYGRFTHVDDLDKVFRELGKEMRPFDNIAQRHILSIAQAHGGKLVSGEKDKIGELRRGLTSTEDYEINMQLLAAIVRLADELADDKSRCTQHLLGEEHINNPSLAFHVYSYCLSCVDINHKERAIKYSFHIPIKYAKEKVQKLDNKVFILDEIYERTEKTFLEILYTMRFTRGIIDIEKLDVEIEFYSDYLDIYKPANITYSLRETGFPRTNATTINNISGQIIADEINTHSHI